MKVQRGPVIQYTITNNKVSFFISSTTKNTSKTLGISIIIYPNSQKVKQKLHQEKSGSLIGQWPFDS